MGADPIGSVFWLGSKLGSTGMEMNWSRPDLSWVNAKKLLIANNNFAPTGYALAA